MISRRMRSAALVSLLTVAVAAEAQTTGFITTRPVCVPPNGAANPLNYIQGPDPILLPGGDVAILVDAGRIGSSLHWEGIFSLIYPGAASVATPRFSGIWATDNFATDTARGEDEAPFPSAIFYNGQWRIAFTTTFRPIRMTDRDRVARLDLANLTYRAQASQVTNQWIKPIDPSCRKLGSCPGRGSGILGTFVLHPNGELFVYHPDGNYPSCASGWVRHKINSNMSVATPAGDGCITLNGLSVAPTWVSDIGRGADGNLYMLTNRPSNLTNIDEWVSTGSASTIGLVWDKTGRTWASPAHPTPPKIYSVWDAGYLKDPSRQIIEPKLIVSQISDGSTFEEINNVQLGRWYLYYWADSGAPLPPNFGGPASSCALAGSHESATCTAIAGWAWDPMFPDTSTSVDVYDGATRIATVPANIYRADLESSGQGNGVHGFSWPVPPSLRDNQAHSIAVNYSGSETRLSSSPKSITCVPSTYALNVSKGGAGSGVVTSSPPGINCGADCSESYNAGTVVSLTGTPAPGSVIVGWSGHSDCVDGSVTMDAIRACIVTFGLSGGNSLTVTKAGTGSGTVTSSPAGISCGADCSEVYPVGTVVSLSTAATSGSTFAGWTGAVDCSDGVVTMSAALSCTATFESSVTARTIWIQPQPSAGFGPPGSLVVAGSASGAPAGAGVVMTWRNLTIGGAWITEPYAPAPDSSGIWYNAIPNASYLQQYQVFVAYGGFTSITCTYQGTNSVTWCP